MASGSRTQSSGALQQYRYGAVEASRFQTALAVNGGSLFVGAFSPPALSSIARTDTLTFDVTGTLSSPSYINVWGVLANGVGLTVWNGTSFVGAFVEGSSTSSLTGGTRFNVAHAIPGWESSTVTLQANAVSATGQVFSGSALFTINNPPAAPVITFTPTGGGIMRRGTVLVDVTDDEGAAAIAYVMIGATLADGSTVPVFSGSVGSFSFGSQVDGASARSFITNGLRHTIVHDVPGWDTSSLVLCVTAIDTGGRMTTATLSLAVTDAPRTREVDLARRRKVYPITRQRPRLTQQL